jgi:hypothetical protein
VLVQEAQEARAVVLAGLAQPVSDGLVDQVLLLPEQKLRDPDGVWVLRLSTGAGETHVHLRPGCCL